MSSYTITDLAYLKVILHAAKYPSSRVIGLLVGPMTNSNEITDAIPLVHHLSNLSMAVEAGLQLADIHCRTRNLSFKGVYVCNDMIDDVTVPAVVVKLASQLAQQAQGSTCIVTVVDNSKLATEEAALILHSVASTSSATLKPLSASQLQLESNTIPVTAVKRARAGEYRSLGDFDDHLEDTTVDWLENKHVIGSRST
ncbi:hypothetical protein OIO90_000720 [Microbotryomycetes sp. JL221]|nr:hypothetical protein OIO90_000720 [Microbotryomycetes sp. JL221]